MYAVFLLLATLSWMQLITGQITMSYYTGWHSTDYPLSSMPWAKYDVVAYAFAETTPDVNTLSLAGSEPALLPDFVATAKANDVKALLSVGGWTGSRFFSVAVGSAENRTAFVETVTNVAVEYQLDGLDFDWEYPNNQGLGCNTIDEDDTANFLAFLQELRGHSVGANLYLSAAVAISPFMNAVGSPSSDVSAFGDLLDHIVTMNYDLWGSWSATVGPNGPLDDSCAASEHQQGSAVAAVNAWVDAGFPREKLVLGLPGYGHSFSVAAEDAYLGDDGSLALYPPFDRAVHPVGDEWDDASGGVDACGVPSVQGGVINFWGLVQQGYLNEDGKPVEGVPFIWDSCSQTPFIYNATTEVMISYDNSDAFYAKGAFVKRSGLGGVAIWEAGSDYDDILLDAVRAALYN